MGEPKVRKRMSEEMDGQAVTQFEPENVEDQKDQVRVSIIRY